MTAFKPRSANSSRNPLLSGERVIIQLRGYWVAGAYEVSWDGMDQEGKRVPSGVYFCKIEIGTSIVVKKMLLL